MFDRCYLSKATIILQCPVVFVSLYERIFLILSPLVTLLFVVRASLSSTAFIPNNEETEIKQTQICHQLLQTKLKESTAIGWENLTLHLVVHTYK